MTTFFFHSGLAVLALTLTVLLVGSRWTDKPISEEPMAEDWEWNLDPSLQVRRDVSRHARGLDFAAYLARMNDQTLKD